MSTKTAVRALDIQAGQEIKWFDSRAGGMTTKLVTDCGVYTNGNVWLRIKSLIGGGSTVWAGSPDTEIQV